MHKISLAPVLSATLSRDSCWIICFSWLSHWFFAADCAAAKPGGTSGWFLLGFLDDLDQPPPLGGAERPGLHHDDAVADAGAVLLVVRLQLAGLPHHLAVQLVLDA